MTRTLSSHCGDPGFDPWFSLVGELKSLKLCRVAEKKTKHDSQVFFGQDLSSLTSIQTPAPCGESVES